MKESIWETSLSDFLSQAASAKPTPGGGSVAMVSASLGLSLVTMSLEISVRKGASGEGAGELERLLAESRALLGTLRGHADADIAAFDGYMAALRLPKDTAEQKAARKAALARACEAATRTPLAAAGDILRALELADRAARLVSRSILSDTGAGVALLGGAMTAVLYNVDVNVGSLPDAAMREAFTEQRRVLSEASARRVSSIVESVSTQLAGVD